jgi:hypothetical protein
VGVVPVLDRCVVARRDAHSLEEDGLREVERLPFVDNGRRDIIIATCRDTPANSVPWNAGSMSGGPKNTQGIAIEESTCVDCSALDNSGEVTVASIWVQSRNAIGGRVESGVGVEEVPCFTLYGPILWHSDLAV